MDSARPGFWLPVGAGALVIIMALLAFGGLLYEIDDPFDNDFARAYQTAIDRLSRGSN